MHLVNWREIQAKKIVTLIISIIIILGIIGIVWYVNSNSSNKDNNIYSQNNNNNEQGENPSNIKGEDLPVENVTWYDAINYCNLLIEKQKLEPVYTIDGENITWDKEKNRYRLTTEAEWEYAARAGTTTVFNTETSIGADKANFYGHYPYLIEENYFSQSNLETQPGVYRQTTTKVGTFSPNKWGLYDVMVM